MNMRPMTKEDNAIYASRSGLVLMAGSQRTQAVDAALTSARAADKAADPTLTFVDAAHKAIERWESYDTNEYGAVY